MVSSLKDIAKRSKVSFQTVSAVLNSRSGNTRVSEKTRERILKAVKDLNYRKNTAGRGLATGRTFTLGFITPSLQYPTNAFFVECFQRLAGEINHGVLVSSLDNHDEMTVSQMKMFSEHCVDGILLNPTMSNKDISCIEIIRQYNIPFVVSADVPEYKVTFASYDNFDSIYQLTDHVLAQGYRRPAMVTSWPSHGGTPRLVQGFHARLQKAGIDPATLPIIHQEEFDSDAIRRTVDKIMNDPVKVDCLLVTDVMVGMQTYLILKNRGITIGSDFGLAVGDDVAWFEEGCLSVTCIRFPIYEIVRTLMAMLQRRIEDPTTPREMKYFKGQLVARKSTMR